MPWRKHGSLMATKKKHPAADTTRLGGADVEWLTLGQAATYLGVGESTVRKWSDEGRLAAFSTPGGHRRFRSSDLDEFLVASRVDAGDKKDVVLVVDDDERRRAVLRYALEQEDYVVREAATGNELADAVEHEPPDLILLDVLVTAFDSLDILCRLRERHGLEAIPVVMFAGAGDGGDGIERTDRIARFVAGANPDPGAVVEAAKRVLTRAP
jgi:excisionase family DNA binding protein